MPRPSFMDLSPSQQAMFGNGVGPYWMSDRARQTITGFASWFFKDASWRHHDFGYFVGGDYWDRERCDWKFFAAMLRDSVTQSGPLGWVLVPVAIIISLFFYICVRVGGGLGSFQYRDIPASLDDVINGALWPSGKPPEE